VNKISIVNVNFIVNKHAISHKRLFVAINGGGACIEICRNELQIRNHYIKSLKFVSGDLIDQEIL